MADASGNLSASTNYDSFGNATTTNFPTRYQFTGREFDSFTNLHYYRARFYDANLGRFISEDPIGFTGGDVNLYGYVWNNPQNFTDPSGNNPFAVGAWALFELGMTGYDIYDFGASLFDPCADWWDVGLGAGGLAMGAVLPGGGYGKLGKGAKKYFRGRRGTLETRGHLDDVRDRFLDDNPDFEHVGGGRRKATGEDIPEEYIPNPNGSRTGGSYPDLTFKSPDGSRVRVNTVDTYANGSPTNRELDNAYRIFENTNEPIFLLPKPKK